jgi:hypothetical protein
MNGPPTGRAPIGVRFKRRFKPRSAFVVGLALGFAVVAPVVVLLGYFAVFSFPIIEVVILGPPICALLIVVQQRRPSIVCFGAGFATADVLAMIWITVLAG